MPATRRASGYATDVKTSPSSLVAAQVHSGQLAASGDPRGWDRAGNITPIQRWATMFSGWGLQNLDGNAWYHPLRLSIDSGAVGDGSPNPAQAVLDVHSTDAAKLRKRMKIYAFAAALGGYAGDHRARRRWLRRRSIPRKNLKLVDRSATYAHNDPSAAEPKVNAFLKKLVPFLKSISVGNKSAEEGLAGLNRVSAAAPGADAAVGDVHDPLEPLPLEDRSGEAAALAATADRGDHPVAG